jgi:hypothetical protein
MTRETLLREQELFAAKPRRQIALAFGGAVLHLAVELVNLLERVGLGGLCDGLGLALGLGDVAVDRVDLAGGQPLSVN